MDWRYLEDTKDVNSIVANFYTRLNSILELHVPKKKYSKMQAEYPPWYNSSIIHLLKLKYKTWRTYKKTNDDADDKIFKDLRSRIKIEVEASFSSYMRNIEKEIKMNANRFWWYLDYKSKSGPIPNTMIYNESELASPESIVRAFAEHFAGDFLPSGVVYCPSPGDAASASALTPPHISEAMVSAAIKRLKPNMTMGPDMIPAFLVRDCAPVFTYPLTIIFQSIIKNSTFPDAWKVSRVCPIHKKNAKNDIANYRQISLICNFSKILEILLSEDLSWHVNKMIIPEQHGFVSGRSTVTNLTCITQYIGECLDRGSQVDVVYTDFSKAFDRLDHGILLCKLDGFGLTSPYINLFRSYLLDRHQYVQIRGFKSHHYHQCSGVPQGSVLGPLLFNIFINDIVRNIDVDCLLYADDVKLFSRVDCVDDCTKLQNATAKMQEWCVLNRLPLNVDKCNVMSFTRKRNTCTYDYVVNGTVLRRPDVIKDLGITFDPKLSFVKHIELVTVSAYKSLGFIIRGSRDFADVETLKLLYSTFVRPKLEYGSVVWSPIYNIHITSLERIQRRFCKFAIYLLDGAYPPRGAPNDLLLSRLALNSLLVRRIAHAVIFLFKILNNSVDCSCLLHRLDFHIPRISARSSNTFNLATPRTNLLRASPVSQMCINYASIENRIDIFNTSCAQIKARIYTHSND